MTVIARRLGRGRREDLHCLGSCWYYVEAGIIPGHRLPYEGFGQASKELSGEK